MTLNNHQLALRVENGPTKKSSNLFLHENIPQKRSACGAFPNQIYQEGHNPSRQMDRVDNHIILGMRMTQIVAISTIPVTALHFLMDAAI